jgi:alpha-D-ribose 1-methylphosphonate 5-phosphate C-P lyase
MALNTIKPPKELKMSNTTQTTDTQFRQASAEYNFGFLDEYAKKEVRRSVLKAIAIPGYQVPYSSREMPMGRGFGTGGLQLTLALIGKKDTLKVIDQGSDDSVNAVNLRSFIEMTCPGIDTTTKVTEANLIQSRHRIPEQPLREDQVLILQVPYPDALVVVESSEDKRKIILVYWSNYMKTLLSSMKSPFHTVTQHVLMGIM